MGVTPVSAHLLRLAFVAALTVVACASPELPEKVEEVEAVGGRKGNGQIAFVRLDASMDPPNADIYLVDADGGNGLRLTDAPGADVEPAWSPEGRSLAFSSDRHGDPDSLHIYTMSAGGKEVQRLTSAFAEADSPSWSPDATEIAFRACCEAGDEIYTIESDGSDPVQVSDEPDDGASGAYWPAWSPDGSTIVHNRIRYNPETQTDSEALYLMSSHGTEVKRLTPEFFFDGAPTWSPDGTRIAFAARRDADEASVIFVMNADGSGLNVVREEAGVPAWSPDGTKIAFASDVDGDSEIYVMSPDGTDVEQLTNNDVHDSDPAWQPLVPSAEAADESSPSLQSTEEDRAVASEGFYPATYKEDDRVVMPATFLDGSTAEIVFPEALGLQDMRAQIFTAGGLEGVDRTINFLYGDPSSLRHSGPTETYGGHDGQPVEVWKPAPRTYGCPNLVYRFGDWFVGVRTCQGELSESEKADWARSLVGHQTEDGFLVLEAVPPLVLQRTGGHEGPELMLFGDGAHHPMIEFEPGRCDPDDVPDEGDIRTMGDGTEVSFSRIEDGRSGIENDWFATWCEDGLMSIQVGYATENFAKSAAESPRARDILLADG
jgi:Tol biopolymer transport system component